jgi:hypothetical protein
MRLQKMPKPALRPFIVLGLMPAKARVAAPERITPAKPRTSAKARAGQKLRAPKLARMLAAQSLNPKSSLTIQPGFSAC